MKLRESLFPVDIRRPSSGVKLLGGAVSRDAYFISGLAMRRAANAVDLMSLLLQLHDPQTDPSDGRSTLSPADVLVFGWVGGKHACVDLTGVSPLVELSSKGFIAGQAALKAASCKMTKHDKACIEIQHVFITFAFDTFGFLAPEAVELLSRVQRVMHSNVMTPRSTDVVFKRIGFAIQKGLAAQLVARLPSTTMVSTNGIIPRRVSNPIDLLIVVSAYPYKVMAAPAISILSDTSKESVGYSWTVSVVLPVRVLDLMDYSSSSDYDPSEDSLPPVPDLPLFPLAPVVASPGIRRRSTTLVRPGEAIPFGRPYRTHPNGPRKLLTARKRVRPIPARRLAWRRVSHHSSDRHSSPDSSSSSAPSDHSLSGHTPPDTTDADSSTPQRFVHRSLARTPRHSEAFRRWRSAPLSTPYPPTTSESSLGSSSERLLDSSSTSFRPSHKRCRSPIASIPSPTHVSRSIAPTPADLLPPRKRFRDSYSPEDSGEEHMEVDTADAEAVADVGISEGVVAHPEDGVGMGFEIAASDVREDDEEFEVEASAADTREIAVDPLVIGDSSESSRGGIPDLEDTIYDIVHYMLEVHIDRVTEIETTQRQLETSQMVASGERASLVERIGSLRLEYLKVRAMLSIERDRIDSIRWHMALSQEEFRQVRRDRDDTRRRLRRLESYIMAASAIAISYDSSDESVGSPFSRVILFGDIPTIIPSTSVGALETSTIALVISSAAPMVETTFVALPTGLCGLVPYLDSDSDSHDERDSP
ncbi:hypothetical protein Tco_0675457 [Tanacetum coccineum]